MLVAVTGGIGSGKSSVATLLGKLLDGIVVDADLVCRDLLEPGQQGFTQFMNSGGKTFLDATGRIDRLKLRRELFRNKSLREKLETILHPLVYKTIGDIVANNPEAIVIAEVPLLYESCRQDEFDAVISVYASEESLIERVVNRDNTTRTETEKIILSQMSIEEKNRRADHIIRNNEEWQKTEQQVTELAEFLKDNN